MAEPIEWRVSWHWRVNQSGYSTAFNYSTASTSDLGTQIQTFSRLLMAMMHEDVELGAVRVSRQGVPRSGSTMKPPRGYVTSDDSAIQLPVFGTLPLAPATELDQSRACVQLRLMKGTRQLSTRYLGPVPDTLLTGDPDQVAPDESQEWYNAFRAWRKHVVERGWGTRARLPARGPDDKQIVSWSVQAAPPNLLEANVAIATPLPPAVGKDVLVSGIKPLRRGNQTMNGTWNVASQRLDVTNGVQVNVLKGSGGVATTGFRNDGFIRLATTTLTTIDFIFMGVAGIHKRGGPFGQRRGRRLTRA